MNILRQEVVQRAVAKHYQAVASRESSAFGGNAFSEIEILTMGCHGALVVAIVNGEVIGHAGGMDGQCWTIAVDEAHQRRGVGRRLLSRLGARDAAVLERNITAQLFFRACGWRCYRVEKHDAWDVYWFSVMP